MSRPMGVDERLDSLADWSPWMPLSEAQTTARRVPGVYMVRDEGDHRILLRPDH